MGRVIKPVGDIMNNVCMTTNFVAYHNAVDTVDTVDTETDTETSSGYWFMTYDGHSLCAPGGYREPLETINRWFIECIEEQWYNFGEYHGERIARDYIEAYASGNCRSQTAMDGCEECPHKTPGRVCVSIG